MSVATSVLFQLLLKRLAPEMVCDVGSLDGDRARRFRRLLPNARIVAFEANPENAREMRNDPRNSAAGIELHEAAAWNVDGSVPFYIERVPDGSSAALRGISSTRRRRPEFDVGTQRHETAVRATRLDTFLRRGGVARTIALWIDVEGAAFEVLCGVGDLIQRVAIVHVEVEAREVWAGQKLDGSVRDYLSGRGFRAILSDGTMLQRDVVFLREDLVVAAPRRTVALVGVARAAAALAAWGPGAALLGVVRRYWLGPDARVTDRTTVSTAPPRE